MLNGYGLFLLKPCQLIRWSTDSNWKGFLIFLKENNLHPQNASPVPKFHFLSPMQHPFFQLSKTEYKFFYETFNQIYQESLEPMPHSLDIVNLYVQILLHKINLRISTSISPAGLLMGSKSRKEEIALKFLQLVDKEIEQMKSVSEFAAALHITPKYLAETVTHVTGLSPKEHISNKIISITKTLLKHTNVNIGSLAEQYNFKEQSHFAHFFKERTGMSPLAYRFS
jgi:AraC-like DNA-binding protein